MTTREFHSLGELEDTKNALARASMHPVRVDLGRTIDNDGTRTGRAGEEFADVRGKRAVWNNREDRMAYLAGSDYTLSQHREVLDHLQTAVDVTTGDVEMGLVRDYGEIVDGLVVFDNENSIIDVQDIVDDGYVPPEGDVDPHGNARARDRLGLAMRFKNSFDGSTRVQAETIGYRFICQNWCVWGEESIGYTDQLHINELTPTFFQDLILEVFDQRDDVIGLVRDAEADEIPLDWAPSVLEQVGFGRNYTKRICEHLDGYTTPREDHTTTWRLYNAATYELDNEVADRVGADVYDEHQHSAEKIIDQDWQSPSETRDFEEVIA